MPDLRSLLAPRSLAVVGASPRNVAAVETVVASGVRAWGVNPKRDEVAGLRCYPSVADLPDVPECAFLMVNHERVEEAFEDAAAAGVRAFVVPGIGAEAGAAAKLTTERLAARAREVGAVLLGPNCMGFYVPGGPAAWNGLPQDTTAPGDVAVLCQSGSIADAFLSLGGRIGLRCVVSSGAEAVTDAADFLAFFADDPDTRAVGLFLETVRRPEAFVDALRACAEVGKPVACLKVGRSEAAARAALSHTGALVGSDRAFSAVLRRHSAIEVGDFHELVETLEILGRRRLPTGTRIAGISESGGECALLADQADAAGIPFGRLTQGLAGALADAFPNYLAPGNPLDAWGIADETEVYPRSLELLAASGEFDILVAQADLSQFRDRTNDEWCELTLRTLARLADESSGLFCAMTTVHSADPPRRFQELSRELDVALLRGPRDAMRALAGVARRRAYAPGSAIGDMPDVSDLVNVAGALPEHESALLLERFGVRFAARIRAATPEQAAAAVEELGAPVVVKRDGPAHKGREGGVVLGLESPDDAAQAARRLRGPVLVARQAEAGTEVLVGMTRDPDFGPILAVGRGGVDVEDLDRVACSSAPLDAASAAHLVADAGVDDPHGVVVATLVALSDLALSNPDIESVEVNPLIVGSADTVAVDALVVVGD
ncbi:MAG TPA: acetate--CoA ligase family protein [Gaiellaceae bacterium]|nr:acetate--CoA ligase family protein [Gaiellaceae bacterium]